MNQYIIEYPAREIDSDFYYVVLKTYKSLTDLFSRLKWGDINVYNIISTNGLRIFILNSESEMNQLRSVLSKLFNPKDNFNYCGEGFSFELCLETVRCMACNIPEYSEYYN